MESIEWIKIATDLYRDPKLQQIRLLPNGNDCVLFWCLLLSRAGECNDNGWVWAYEDANFNKIPYSIKDLSKTFNFSQKKILNFLQIFEKFSMIFLENFEKNLEKKIVIFSIKNWEKHQNKDRLEKIKKGQRERTERHRAKKKKELEERMPELCNVTGNVTEPLQNDDCNVTPLYIRDYKSKENTTTITTTCENGENLSEENRMIFGEFGNVSLTKEQYQKMLGICASQKLLDELIDSLDKKIGTGDEKPYSAELPNGHYIRLKAYYDYRRKHPNEFNGQKNSSSKSYSTIAKDEESKINEAISNWSLKEG